MSVDDLITQIGEGRFRIPDFQRELQWQTHDRVALLDSIYRGYPVGTILLWKNPPQPDIGRPVGDPTQDLPEGDVFCIVDGQQRIHSLWKTLGQSPVGKEYGLVFDPDSDRFLARMLSQEERAGQPPEKPEEVKQLIEWYPQVPVHVLVDSIKLSSWVPRELPDSTKRLYFELGKRIREYKLSLYVVEEADIDQLRNVFDRINTSGKPLTRDQVFESLVGTQIEREGDRGLSIANRHARDRGFGGFEHPTILKVIAALSGHNINNFDPHQLDRDRAKSILHQAAIALGKVVDFYIEVARVPRAEVCPYELPTVVLARFFQLHPAPHPRNEVLLRRWFWRGVIAGRFSGDSNSIQKHVNDINEKNESSSVQALLRRSGSPDGVRIEDQLPDFSLNTASGKAILCVLLEKRPRDLSTGETLSLDSLLAPGVGSVLRPIVSGQNIRIPNRLANVLVHPAGQPVKKLILSCQDEAALLSHGINDECREALRSGNSAMFFEIRSRLLGESIRKFQELRAELSRDDAPPARLLALRGVP